MDSAISKTIACITYGFSKSPNPTSKGSTPPADSCVWILQSNSHLSESRFTCQVLKSKIHPCTSELHDIVEPLPRAFCKWITKTMSIIHSSVFLANLQNFSNLIKIDSILSILGPLASNHLALQAYEVLRWNELLSESRFTSIGKAGVVIKDPTKP